MKICIVSFDIWGFDQFIKENLESHNIETQHICLSKFKYKYKSFREKILNFFLKKFLRKNLKKVHRENFILEEINKIGHFDQILIISPELISYKTLQKIKQKTNRFITFLYDSLDRIHLDDQSFNLFDSVYSFDTKDCKEKKINFLTNYIYQKKQTELQQTKYKFFAIYSKDNRFNTLKKIDKLIINDSKPSLFIIHTKHDKQIEHSNIRFVNDRVTIKEMNQYLDESEIFVDLIRENQTGLSFRIFEALAYQKKIITTNHDIVNYDFYNPNNILVIDKNNPEIPNHFLESNYEPIPNEIYNKYTIESWCKQIFRI